MEGAVLGEHESIYRSGLFDSLARISVTLVGGPAMSLGEMRKWQQKTLPGENPATLQQNSRVGITAAFPLTRHQSSGHSSSSLE